MHDTAELAEILARLTRIEQRFPLIEEQGKRIEEAIAGIGHNGGPPLDEKPPPALHDPLLKPDDAAAYIKTSVVTLERKRRKRTGPDYIKTGGRIFYRKSALDRYLAACTRQGSRARGSAKEI
jgi:hypothetical protein